MNQAQIYIEYEGVRYTQEQWALRQIEKKLDALLALRQASITEAVTTERERCAAIAEAMGCDAVAVEIRSRVHQSKTG